MIRLALLGEETAVGGYAALAPRLPTASLTPIADIRELDSGAFDAVVLVAQETCHDLCRYSVARDKHVLVSGPIDSWTNGMALTQECQRHNVCLMAGDTDRFLPSVRTIKESLDAGQLGEPGLIRVHRWQSPADGAVPESTDIDLALWMFRTLPTEVYAIARRGVAGAVTTLQIHLGFPGGGMALIDRSDELAAVGGYFSLSLIGSRGAAYSDDHHNGQLLFRGDHPVSLKTGEGHAARWAQLQEFLAAIDQQREPAVTGMDLCRAMLVREAAWASVESGRTARLTGERYAC